MLIKTMKSPDPSGDFTYSSAQLNYWLFIEVHTAIVIACLMTLKPLLARLAPNLLSGPSDSPSDGSDMTPDGPPLTIGSRPLRNGQVRPDSWMAYGVRKQPQQQYDQGDIGLEDVQDKRDASHRVHHQRSPYSSTRAMEAGDLKPSGSATSELSDRTEDYQPTAEARSMS